MPRYAMLCHAVLQLAPAAHASERATDEKNARLYKPGSSGKANGKHSSARPPTRPQRHHHPRNEHPQPHRPVLPNTTSSGKDVYKLLRDTLTINGHRSFWRVVSSWKEVTAAAFSLQLPLPRSYPFKTYTIHTTRGTRDTMLRQSRPQNG